MDLFCCYASASQQKNQFHSTALGISHLKKKLTFGGLMISKKYYFDEAIDNLIESKIFLKELLKIAENESEKEEILLEIKNIRDKIKKYKNILD